MYTQQEEGSENIHYTHLKPYDFQELQAVRHTGDLALEGGVPELDAAVFDNPWILRHVADQLQHSVPRRLQLCVIVSTSFLHLDKLRAHLLQHCTKDTILVSPRCQQGIGHRSVDYISSLRRG